MNDKYLIFPISMLKMNDIKQILSNAMDFTVAKYSKISDLSQNERLPLFIEVGLNDFLIKFKNPITALERSQRWMEFSRKVPMTSVRLQIAWDFYENDKSMFEINVFRMYLGLRSIIGKKIFCKTTRKMINGRMYGFNTPKEIPENLILKRFTFDRILRELETNWFLKSYAGHSRGYYVSFAKNMTLNLLAEKCEAAKQKNRDLLLAVEKQNAAVAAKMKFQKL